MPAGLREQGLLVKSIQRQCGLNPLLRKPRAILGHQRHLRHREVKREEKAKNWFNLVRQQTSVLVHEVTLCVAPLLTSPRTGFS